MFGPLHLQRYRVRLIFCIRLNHYIQQVHLDQLAHVRKGCLARIREDISTDGSRIETSHKQWNLLMRCQASGLANMLHLGYDFTHRRNSRLGQRNDDMRARRPFLSSGHGSHHTALTNHANHIWNEVIDTTRRLYVNNKKATLGLVKLPSLPDVKSDETFGVVHSTHAETFGGLYTIKEEDEDVDAIQLRLVEEDADVLQDLKIDPSLLQLPLEQSLTSPVSYSANFTIFLLISHSGHRKQLGSHVHLYCDNPAQRSFDK